MRATSLFIVERWFPVKTARLLLREFTAADEADIHEYAQDPCVSRYDSWGPNTVDDTKSVMARWLKDQEAWPRRDVDLAVEMLETSKVIGVISLRLKDGNTSSGDLGYAFNRRYWRQGYATEACRAILHVAFGTLQLHRVWASCDTRNIASARVMEKLGMRREAHFKEDVFQKGIWRDTYVYAILAEDWAASHQGKDPTA